MLPSSFSEEAARRKHIAQLQHNMSVTNARSAALRSSLAEMDRDDHTSRRLY